MVGDDSAGFSDIVAGFKNRYPTYKNTDIRFTKFSSYSDYEKTLLSVIADGNSPDIFVVNNNGGKLLESKILGIPATIINPDEFSKNFEKVFDDLLIQSNEKGQDGKTTTVSGLKGVPMGYETLGLFYNWKLVRSVPGLWDDIGKDTAENATDEYVPIMLGLGGRSVPVAGDILAGFMLQNNIASYSKMTDPSGVSALQSYLSFAPVSQSGGSSPLKSEMDQLGLSTVDLFVRGKVGMLIGYPSLLREIQYSIKRASSASVLSDKFLRTSELPQIHSTGEMVNLAHYQYFALSKGSKNPEAGYAFLSYLSSREADEKYLRAFPFYLPAQRALIETRLNEPVDKDYKYVKYTNFYDTTGKVGVQSFDKGLKNEYDAYFSDMLDRSVSDPKNFLDQATKYIDCNTKHFIDLVSPEEECRMY